MPKLRRWVGIKNLYEFKYLPSEDDIILLNCIIDNSNTIEKLPDIVYKGAIETRLISNKKRGYLVCDNGQIIKSEEGYHYLVAIGKPIRSEGDNGGKFIYKELLKYAK